MKYASTLTFSPGPCPLIVPVDTAVRRGIPRWSLNNGSRSTMDRIRSAILQSGYSLPFVTVLSEASSRAAPHMDLALAVSVLTALELIPDRPGCAFAGELSLSGEVRPCEGLLWMLLAAKNAGISTVVMPEKQRHAAVVEGLEYWFVQGLRDLRGKPQIERASNPPKGRAPEGSLDHLKLPSETKRAFAAAAAGMHNCLFIGPPGTGKSTLAMLLAAFAPAPDEIESLEIAAQTGLEARDGFLIERPVRMPHHSCGPVSLIGGGVPLRPGEATKAHNGILVLDELAEFSRQALQALREPVSNGLIHAARGARSEILPARFLLAATTNPCPCGQLANPKGQCSCTKPQSDAYIRRITGPLLDRFEIEIDMRKTGHAAEPDSETIRAMIARAAEAQRIRSGHWRFNSRIPASEFDRFRIAPCVKEEQLSAAQSQRKLHGILRVARTLADLDNCEELRASHLREAASFVCVDEIRASGPGNA